MLYACDGEWWEIYHQQVCENFPGEKWTNNQGTAAKLVSKYGINCIEAEFEPGLGKQKLHLGGNSGYQAVNLAYLMGAEKIILLGFDMQRTDGKEHWHGRHVNGLNRCSPYKTFVKNFDALAADLKQEGIPVLNATRQTALNCFNKVTLEEALC